MTLGTPRNYKEHWFCYFFQKNNLKKNMYTTRKCVLLNRYINFICMYASSESTEFVAVSTLMSKKNLKYNNQQMKIGFFFWIARKFKTNESTRDCLRWLY